MAAVALRDSILVNDGAADGRAGPTAEAPAMLRHESLFRATESHEAVETFELTFSAGRMFTNVKPTGNPDMLFGRLEGRNGVFPKAKAVHVCDEAHNLHVPLESKGKDKAKDKDKKKKSKGAQQDADALSSLASSLAGEQRVGLVLVHCYLEALAAGQEPLFALLPGDVIAVNNTPPAGTADDEFSAVYAGESGRIKSAAVALFAGPDAQAMLVIDAGRAANRARTRSVRGGVSRSPGAPGLDPNISTEGSDSDSEEEPDLSPEALGPILYDGTLDKKGGSRHSWKKRFFHLHANYLVYRAKARDKKIKGVVKLAGAILETLEHESNQCRFAMNTPKRKWVFRCKKESVRTDWMRALQEAIDAAR